MEARPVIPPQTLDTLVRKLGHDVRGSLFVLDGCLDMAEMGVLEERDLIERLRQVRADLVSRLDAFTESMRVVAVQPDSGNDSRPLENVLDEVVAEVATIAAIGDVRLERTATAPAIVAAEPRALRRLLLNVLLRGVRQAQAGEVVRMDGSGPSVRISHPERRLRQPSHDPLALLQEGELELAAAILLADDLGTPLSVTCPEPGVTVVGLEVRTA